MSGVIPGKKLDKRFTKEYMASKVNVIKQEIKFHFPKESGFYIYFRFFEEKRIFRIFVTLLNDTKINYREMDITFQIVVTADYPERPPIVNCLTTFNEKLDIFDMRNIQINLIPHWKQNNKVWELIQELPNFVDAFDHQVMEDLCPLVGHYSLNSIKYDVNDFLLNKNNILYKIKIPRKEGNHTIFDERFLIITKSSFMILKSIDMFSKNLCLLTYVGDLIGVEEIKRFIKPQEEFQKFSCFQFEWNEYAINTFKTTLCSELNTLNAKKITEKIKERKEIMKSTFKYFENSLVNDTQTIEKIISIKQDLISNNVNDNIFEQIHRLYKRIIDIYITLNDQDSKIYIEKLKNVIDNYQKMKEYNKGNNNMS